MALAATFAAFGGYYGGGAIAYTLSEYLSHFDAAIGLYEFYIFGGGLLLGLPVGITERYFQEKKRLQILDLA